MLSVRWLKVVRDLGTNKLRSLLAIFAIAIGIFGVGSILSADAILTREIKVNFASTNPPSAILYTDGADRDLAQAVAARPDVAQAEARRVLNGRIAIGDNLWRTLILFVIDDFSRLQVSTFTPDGGNFPPADGEILLERSSVDVSGHRLQDTAVIQLPDGSSHDLQISGIVHDPAQAPGWQDGVDYGYVSRDTLAQLGQPPTFDQLQIVVAENAGDVPHITDVAYQVKAFVQQQGYPVSLVAIPTPGQHPHTDQMDSLLFLFEAFGILALILSAVLVANIISALLAQQIRQIGMMKAVGAPTRQIAGLYFTTVLILGVVALVIGIPLGVAAGRAYAAFTAVMLNFEITSDSIPAWVYLVQIAVGLIVPLLAASLPVIRGSRLAVQQAVGDYGIGSGNFGTGWIDTISARVRGLPRPLLISLRSTFRRRVRLLLDSGHPRGRWRGVHDRLRRGRVVEQHA